MDKPRSNSYDATTRKNHKISDFTRKAFEDNKNSDAEDSDIGPSRKRREIEKQKKDIVDIIFEISKRNETISKTYMEKRSTQISNILNRITSSIYHGQLHSNLCKQCENINNISNVIQSYETTQISHQRNNMIFRYALKKGSVSDAYYQRYISPLEQQIKDLENQYKKGLTDLGTQLDRLEEEGSTS